MKKKSVFNSIYSHYTVEFYRPINKIQEWLFLKKMSLIGAFDAIEFIQDHRGRSQFTFTLFSRFLTTHLPLVYNHLHLIDHLPICKCLLMSLDHPY